MGGGVLADPKLKTLGLRPSSLSALITFESRKLERIFMSILCDAQGSIGW